MRQLEMKHGTEGPQFDPYGWVEYKMITDEQEVIYHSGLLQWIEINGVRHQPPAGLSVELYNSWGDRVFEAVVGLTTQQFERAYDRIRFTCQTCKRYGNTREMSGYPGETFHVCLDCGMVVSSDFNETAVI